jgi:3-isopropylmalate/(R)-2-methylmalate dehydratase large subunit
MGKTITEKILSRAAGKDVSPGDYIEVTSRMPYNLGILPRGMKQMNLVGTRKVFNPEMMRIVDGHFGSTASHHAGELRSNSRTWAKEIGIPQENIFDLGRGGVEHIIASENGWALPGEIYFSDVNGHTTTLGALGGFCITLSYGSGAYMITGKTWIRVPESVKIIVNGKLPHGITGRDVSE